MTEQERRVRDGLDGCAFVVVSLLAVIVGPPIVWLLSQWFAFWGWHL